MLHISAPISHCCHWCFCWCCCCCREYWEAHAGKDDDADKAKPHRANKERTVIVDGYQVSDRLCVQPNNS
jgi:hypothetical protein